RSQENNWPEIKNMRRDVWIGMFFSNLVMFFIILTAGAVLHPAGITDIQTAAQAAEALSPLAGKYASLLFTLGVVGVGLLAIPVLAGSAAYVLSESFRWREGLYRKLKNAYAFYGVIIASIIIGLILNFAGFDPIKALIYAAIINGLIAPIIMVFILLVSNDKKRMGEYVNKPGINFLGWIVTIFMILVALASIYVIFN
ncbi:MAG: divalent metal cation transporter, partial [Patescibacteria group bacterium]|nr:divalent metal cation transporter [Patescibacteria group bacterium]